MRRFGLSGLALVGAASAMAESPRAPVVVSERAAALHASALVIDGHIDLPWKLREKNDVLFERRDLTRPQSDMDTDLPRLRKGGLGAVFWSAYVPVETAKGPGAAHATLEQIDLILRMIDKYPRDFGLARTASEIRRLRREGKIASLIGIEGGHSIENSLAILRDYRRLGAAYLTLTHSDTTEWADAATDEPKHGGLSPFGEDVVRELNRLGMLVDISHVSIETMRDALRVSKAPVIASHSSARAIADHPRNVPDDILRELKNNGGVVMVNFYSGFVVPEGARAMKEMFAAWRDFSAKIPNEAERKAAMVKWRSERPFPAGTIHHLVDHINHIAKVAGVDHVGLGSDFDGVTTLPAQLEDVACYPRITQELLNRGYSDADVRKVLGENVLRVMEKVEAVAAGR